MSGSIVGDGSSQVGDPQGNVVGYKPLPATAAPSLQTPLDIITLALKTAGVVGVGQTPLAEDTNDAFNVLNAMLATWQRQRWLIWHLVDVAAVSTGAESYGVGPGQPFNVPRPDRLEAAFFRQMINSVPNQVDFPLEVLEAREDYNNIALKQMPSFPYWIFYDAAYPIGAVFPWPVPQASIYEIHITLKEQLSQFNSLTQAFNLPPEYMGAILWNLTVELGPLYQMEPKAVSIAKAAKTLAVIRGANAQIPRLQMPPSLSRPGLYNIYSDTCY